MNCREINEILSAYVYNVLDNENKELVQKHLKQCDECRKKFFLLKENMLDFTRVEKEKAPNNFLEEVNKRLDKKLETRAVAYPFYYKIGAIAALFIIGIALMNTSVLEIKKEKFINKGMFVSNVQLGLMSFIDSIPRVKFYETVNNKVIVPEQLEKFLKEVKGRSIAKEKEKIITLKIPTKNYKAFNEKINNTNFKIIKIIQKNERIIIVNVSIEK